MVSGPSAHQSARHGSAVPGLGALVVPHDAHVREPEVAVLAPNLLGVPVVRVGNLLPVESVPGGDRQPTGVARVVGKAQYPSVGYVQGLAQLARTNSIGHFIAERHGCGHETILPSKRRCRPCCSPSRFDRTSLECRPSTLRSRFSVAIATRRSRCDRSIFSCRRSRRCPNRRRSSGPRSGRIAY